MLRYAVSDTKEKNEAKRLQNSEKMCIFAVRKKSKKNQDMKKVLMLMFAAVALSLPSQAQVKFGLKGGLNLTNFSLNESISANMKSKEGFHIGPTVKIGLPVTGLSLDASALYDQRSAKAEANGVSSTIKSQSIQVPINVRYGVGLGSVANLFAFAGPQFGFNLGDKNQKLLSEAANWTLRSSNVSANVGIGATILDHLQISANYNFALGKTGEVEFWDAAKNTWNAVTDGKASSWQVSAAYFF